MQMSAQSKAKTLTLEARICKFLSPIEANEVYCLCSIEARYRIQALIMQFHRYPGKDQKGDKLKAYAKATGTNLHDWMDDTLYLVKNQAGAYQWLAEEAITMEAAPLEHNG